MVLIRSFCHIEARGFAVAPHQAAYHMVMW